MGRAWYMLINTTKGVDKEDSTINIIMKNGTVFYNKDVVALHAGSAGYLSEFEKWVIYVEKCTDGIKIVHLNRDEVAAFELDTPYEETNTE